jgi:hypothetical protein
MRIQSNRILGNRRLTICLCAALAWQFQPKAALSQKVTDAPKCTDTRPGESTSSEKKKQEENQRLDKIVAGIWRVEYAEVDGNEVASVKDSVVQFKKRNCQFYR